MNIFVIASGLLAVALYFPLCRQIWRGSVVQNLATWMLWVTLDVIALLTVLFQHGNYLTLLAYVIGGTTTCVCIYQSGNFKWTRFETFITGLVVLSIVMWVQSGPWMATIISSVAVGIAGFPQIVDSWKKPHENPFWIYVGYFIANCLSIVGGKDWSVEERFYGEVTAILCLAIVVAIARKAWLPKPEEKTFMSPIKL